MAQQQTIRGKKPEAAGSGVGKTAAATAPNRHQDMVYESINPTFHWSRQSGSHVLRLDLPGFKKDDLKVQVDNSGKLSVRGRRQVDEGRCCRFDQVFDVPKGCDIDLVTGKFDDGRLTITMPEFAPKPDEQKMKPPQPGHKEAEEGSVNGSTKVESSKKAPHHDSEMQKRATTKEESLQRQQQQQGEEQHEEEESWLSRAGLALVAESLLEKINENKKVIAVAVVAFSVGLCVSRKLRS